MIRIKNDRGVIINSICIYVLMLHGNVPVRLATGDEVEVKYLKAGDRVETADGGSIGITAIVKESCEHAVFATVPGSTLRAYPGTRVFKNGAWVSLDTLGNVLPREPCDLVYSLHSDWAIYLRVPAILCGGLAIEIKKDIN